MKHFSALMLLTFTLPLIAAASQSPKDLFEAAEMGNIEAVRAFIEGGTQVNTIDSHGGDTPLHLAAYYGHAAVAQLLIENGAQVNATNISFGNTALHWAANNGHAAVAQLLIENGANINAINSFSDTPLHRAASNGHAAVAQLLIENGANVNAINSYCNTRLHRVASNGHTAVTQLFGKIKALLDAIKKHDVATLNTTGIEWFCEQALAYALKEQEKGRSENTDAIVQMLSTAATKHLCSQRENVIAQVCRNNHKTSSIWHLLSERQGTYPPAQRRRLDQPAPLTPSAAGPASAAATVSKL